MFQIEVLESVESTQDIVKEKAAAGAAEGTVVQGLEQLGGRGRQGNIWISPQGNLYMSVLLRPACAAEKAGQMAFVVALAVSEGIAGYARDSTITLKWPNDILINGLKNCGILLESNIKDDSVDFLILGIGLNVQNAPEGAACLQDFSENPLEINAVRDKVLESLGQCYLLWQEKGFAPIRESWLKQAHGLGQPMTARLAGGSETGLFAGIDEDGSLLLDQDGAILKITAAEIHFGA